MGKLPVSPDVIALNPGLVGAMESIPASKYHNVQTEAHGLRFQSGHEAAVISGLILMEKQHKIFALRLQVRFPLPGKNVYVADAVHLDERLRVHVTDAKGVKTEAYRIKKKLFEEVYNCKIEEI